MSDRFDSEEEKAFYGQYRRYFEAPDPDPGAFGCPGEKLLAGFLYEVLPPAEMRRIESHVGACPSCPRRLEDLRRADERMDEQSVPEAVRQRIRRRVEQARRARLGRWTDSWRAWATSFSSWKLAGLAAGLLLALIFWYRPDTPPPISGGPDVSEVRGQFKVIYPQGRLSSVPDELRWERAPDATAYTVTLYEGASPSAIYEQKVGETHLRLPAEARSRLQRRQVYRWQVTGLSPTGDARPFNEGRFEIQ